MTLVSYLAYELTWLFVPSGVVLSIVIYAADVGGGERMCAMDAIFGWRINLTRSVLAIAGFAETDEFPRIEFVRNRWRQDSTRIVSGRAGSPK